MKIPTEDIVSFLGIYPVGGLLLGIMCDYWSAHVALLIGVDRLSPKCEQKGSDPLYCIFDCTPTVIPTGQLSS